VPLVALAVAALQTAPPASPEPHLVLTGAGRFAIFGDLSTRRRENDLAEIRSLQVSDVPFVMDGVAYVGGWSNWRFDCVAYRADRLDFASLRDNGMEGPTTREPSPPYPAAPGGDAAELLALACGEDVPPADARTVEEAVRLGQRAVAGDPEPR
jgi:hypothetical protein